MNKGMDLQTILEVCDKSIQQLMARPHLTIFIFLLLVALIAVRSGGKK